MQILIQVLDAKHVVVFNIRIRMDSHHANHALNVVVVQNLKHVLQNKIELVQTAFQDQRIKI